MFRTRTGQTGRDAYINESAAIANSYRELEARMSRLTAAIADESAEGDLVAHVKPSAARTLVLRQDLSKTATMFNAARASDLTSMLLSTPERPFVREA